VPVDAALARALLEEQFPRLAPARVALLGEGWDNHVFAVDEEWVFRFPRRAAAVPLLEAELRLLPRIAPRVPLAVPLPELRGSPGPRFPWPFAGYRRLPGRTAERAGLTPAQRAAAAAPLGGFLRALHALPPAGATGDSIGRLDAARLRREIRRRLADAAPPWIDDPVRAPRAAVLVHGDLHARQLLFERGALSGVLDWGDVHQGDPACDLSVAYAFLPEEARPAFFAAYGAVDDATARLARLRAVHVSAALLEYARDTADRPLAEEAAAAIRRA
jgi:aminoglycoside phosphotransferase (APT) family kinase protein